MTIIKVEHIGTQNFTYTTENAMFTEFYITVKDETTNEEKQIEVNDISCELKIQIDLKTYDTNKQYYYINYTWNYNGDTPEKLKLAKKLHPMYCEPRFIRDKNDGEIIYKNKLSQELVKYLLKPLNDLKDVNSDYVCPYSYQKKLLNIVSLLWD
jgi:hypothetical protein